MKRIPEGVDDGLCLRAHGQSPYSNMQVAGAESTCAIDAPFAQHCIGSGGGGRHRSMGADSSGSDDQESASQTESSQTASVALAVDESPANSGQETGGREEGEDISSANEDAVTVSSGRDAEEELSGDGSVPCQMSDICGNEGVVQTAEVSDCSNSVPADGDEEGCSVSPSLEDSSLHQGPEAVDLEPVSEPSIDEDDSPTPSTDDAEQDDSSSLQELDSSSPDLLETCGAEQEIVEDSDDTNVADLEPPTSASLEDEERSEETTEEKATLSSGPSPSEEQEVEVSPQCEEEKPTVDGCESDEHSSVVDSLVEEPLVQTDPGAPKSILKNSRSKKNRRRVTFNETMTIYSEEFSVPRQEALRVKEVPERAFDPPLEYQDWEPFEPPAEYRDLEAEIAAIRNSGVSGDTPLVLRSLGAVLFEWFDPCPGPSSTQAFPMPHEESEDFVVHYNTDRDIEEDRDECLTPPPGGEENATELLHNDNGTRDTEGPEENAKAAVEEEEASPKTRESKEDEADGLVSTPHEDTEASLLSSEEPENAVETELSPPLKELALLGPPGPKPAGESWRVSSQHETDSDSSASSQDTMILMTTEESRRNEEHIRDSFRRYESLRRRILGDHGDELRMLSQPDIPELLASGDADGERGQIIVERSNSVIRRTIEKSAMKRNLARATEVRRRQRTTTPRPKSPTPLQDSLVEKLRWLTDMENSISADNLETAPQDKKDSSQRSDASPPSSTKSTETSNRNGSLQRSVSARISPVARPSSFERSLDSPSSSSSRERALATMAIPQDVREWKISPGLTAKNAYHWKMSPDLVPDKNCKPLVDHVVRRSTSAEHLPASFLAVKGGGHDPSLTTPEDNEEYGGRGRVGDQQHGGTSDELEQFVEQYLERIERIRKRYSLTEEAELSLGFVRRPSVRGIRPRFGSTTEILKQMQSQIQPPPLASPSCARSHVTWPYVDVGDLSSQQRVFQGTHHHHHHYHPHRASMLARVLEDEPSCGPKQGLRNDRQPEDAPGSSQNDTSTPVSVTPSVVAPPPSSGGSHIRTKKNKGVAPGSSTSVAVNQKLPVSAAISCPVTKDERGAPEGASSSPKVSSDSLYHQGGLNQASPSLDSPSKEGFIYYSLKV